jgi:acetyltransferase-like isoleucine patch superfamily enzyme
MLLGLKEVGIRKAFRYFYTTLLAILYKLMIFPQLRVAFLRACGARIGRGTIICSGVRFINLHRTGYRGLCVGDYCWISEEVMLDLADRITLGNNVTIGQRAILLTHLNVGYEHHPLQASFPARQQPVRIADGSFVGPYAIVVAGVEVGAGSFVMARTLLSRSLGDGMFRSEVTREKKIPVAFFAGQDDNGQAGARHEGTTNSGASSE